MYYSLPLDELSSFTGKTIEALKGFAYRELETMVDEMKRKKAEDESARKWEQDHSSTIQSRLDRRKSKRRVPIEEGKDESDYYFCPTCYAIIGTHDESAVEHGSYCPDCGQKLTWQEYYEKRIQDRLKSLIRDGSLQVEIKDGVLFCCLMGGTPFVVEAPLTAGDEYQMICNIAITLMHPGAFGISREVMEKIRTVLWED